MPIPFRHRFRILAAAAALVCLPASRSQPALQGLDWPQWRGAGRDGVWRETGLLEHFPAATLQPRWRARIANGYSGPTVAAGRVYVTDRVTDPEQQERVHCFDAETGRRLWSHAYACTYAGISYPNGPRASVTVHEGRAYALGAMGHLHCLDAADGRVLWKHELHTAYRIRMPDWGIAAAPLVEGDAVIVMISGAPDACLAAFDRRTGRELWKALPDRATYSAPIVIDQARRRVLVAWTADRLVGMDPGSGRLLWEHPWPQRMNVDGVVTPVVEGDRLFVSSVYEGCLMLRLDREKPAVSKEWEFYPRNPMATRGMLSLLSTPIFQGGHLYGIDYYGELRCLDARSGDRVWENLTVVPRAMWGSAHMVRQGDRVWIFNERGQLILCRLSPQGYEEISRAQLIAPTRGQLNQRGGVAWAHPAYAYRHVFARNDEELICVSLAAPP